MAISQSIIAPKGLSVFRDIPPAEDLAKMLMSSNFLQIPSTGWTSTLVAGGTVSQGITSQRINPSVTANSSSLLTILTWTNFGLGSTNAQFIDWNKKLYFITNICFANADTEGIGRFQIKEVTTLGALAAKGIGIQIDNLALSGESYGTSLATVSLGTTLTAGDPVKICIVHDPSIPRISWYINNVLKGTQSTAAKIPSGLSSAATVIAASTQNGATGGVNYIFDFSNPVIWQEV